MKLTKVLLRWYKSFNTSYSSHFGSDRRSGKERPWNKWKLANGAEEIFPFVEIPVDHDITTVVGANESGKSHLLNAISKVVTGRGIPGDPFSKNSESKPYSQTDLCHFASLLGKNIDIWPHVGVEFSALSNDDISSIGKAVGKSISAKTITLILTNESEGCIARLYLDNDLIALDEKKLAAVRNTLPRVLFINSQLAIADEISLCDLLAAYGKSTSKRVYFSSNWAQKAAQFLTGLSLIANQAVTADLAKEINALKANLDKENAAQIHLELMLFRDVLGISVETLETLHDLESDDRGHAESFIARWNEEIERKLNLSRYWQQDQEFSLKIDYKKGVLYFEISDKTGCVYTFRERSSGLRYFLSYYIQAKALEAQFDGRDSVILMDEPDSFLSILGQRNLLSIFESLVSASLSKQKTQVLYTTHSPFLINRNFPSRIRLVRKGDGEEGTQFVDQSRIRRFEPVRSALGIDLAQTLFMGGTNILLEGPTDQFLISELVRVFSGTEGANDLLDLNSVVLVSAESAPGVEQILNASKWTDEPIPTAIVILDADGGGELARNRITGKARNSKRLVDDNFVALISDVISPHGKNKRIVTTEDIVPVDIYKLAVERYLKKWLSLSQEQEEGWNRESSAFSTEGLVDATLKALRGADIAHSESYDKMGVLHEALTIVRNEECSSEDMQQLKANLLTLSRFLRAKIEESHQAEKLRSGKQAIHRIVGDFFVKNKESSTPYELELIFSRLEREAASFGDDADELRTKLSTAKGMLKKLRDASRQFVNGDDWLFWHGALENIRKNPLQPDVVFNSSEKLVTTKGEKGNDSLAKAVVSDPVASAKEA